jgi:hypothetical protein
MLIAASTSRHGLQALVPAALALVMVATGVFVARRLRAGRYPEGKVRTQRIVSVAFVLTGAAFFVTSLTRL